MRAEFAGRLRCPACRGDGTLELRAQGSDEYEVREGELRCTSCATAFALHRGVPELLHDPPRHIELEAAGLARFAEQMRLEGWDREVITQLPKYDHGYWYVQARSMDQLMGTVPFRPGQSIVDVGSNTCWASNVFAKHGLQTIALDITTTELQGLYTAEYFIDDGRVFFERVLGSMDAIPLASSSVDYVYCCEVLHHNDPQGLRRTFAEIFRVLRPGGRLLMVNETLKTLRDPDGVHVEGVAQFDGYEHAHWALNYRLEAMRAGLLTEVTEPHYRPFFGDARARLPPEASKLYKLLLLIGFALRRFGLARRLYLVWLNQFWGGVQMNMIATKPRRYIGRDEGMGALQRAARSFGAGSRDTIARLLGRGPARIPRTPEQAAKACGSRASE